MASLPKSVGRIFDAVRKASTRAANCSLYVRMMDARNAFDWGVGQMRKIGYSLYVSHQGVMPRGT